MVVLFSVVDMHYPWENIPGGALHESTVELDLTPAYIPYHVINSLNQEGDHNVYTHTFINFRKYVYSIVFSLYQSKSPKGCNL